MKKSLWLGIIFLSLFLLLFSFNKINLATADIGRHITNGNVFLHSAEYGISKARVLYTNLFSYTYPDFPFINHHWASGILIYLLFNVFGFSGLSLVYFLLILGAFIFVSAAFREDVDTTSLLCVGIFLMPLIAGRTEVRPEGLSYLFLGIFFYILCRYSKGRLHATWLWVIPILELIWANSHIYFIFGPFLIGVFMLESLLHRNRDTFKKLAKILVASTLALLLTPYGIHGALYPFTIFQNYGYRIVENQSIHFLENLSLVQPDFLWYKITLVLIVLSSLFVYTKQRKSFLYALSFITLTFAVLGYLGIRAIPLCALFALPLLAYNLTVIRKILHRNIDEDVKIIIYAVIFILLVTLTMFQFSAKLPWNRDFGLGVKEGGLAPIEFIKNNNIHGPFFNNYDVGGLMIFGLYPKEKVFVDNRPEAYPKEFFENVYVPMQEDTAVWERELLKNKFNAIFFYRLDYTPWSQAYLISRIKDPLWAPVYVDNETILFLYRNKDNENSIKKYELPKEMFSVK